MDTCVYKGSNWLFETKHGIDKKTPNNNEK
jgi:hypothetical protein